MEVSSEILWEATGQRFGNCPVTVRPCRNDCPEFPVDMRMWSYGQWLDNLWPYPTLIGGQWFNIACGSCSGDCSCNSTSEVLLTDPVWQIEEVVVDGVVLVSGADYVLYDGQRLVRVGGEWPLCQDWHVTGGPGAWSIKARFGAPVPTLGQQANGVLALEIAKSCSGLPCQLPPEVTQVTRQGVTMSRMNASELLKEGLTGLWLPDRFIATYNPHGLIDRARAWSPDVMPPRIQT